MQIFFVSREKSIIKQAVTCGFAFVTSAINECAIIMHEYSNA